MSVTVTTAPVSNRVADAAILTPAATTTGGMAFDAVAVSFDQTDAQINDLAAKVLAQGSANNGTTLRALTDAYMTTGSGDASSYSQSLLAIAATSSELVFAHTNEITSGTTATVSLPNCSAGVAVLAGFNYPLSDDAEVDTLTFQCNGATYANGQLSWSPTVTLNDGSNSYNGNATFLAIGFVNNGGIPASQTVTWHPSDGPTASIRFTGLSAEMGSAAVFVDAFSVTYGTSHNVMDFALATFNQTVQVFCEQEQGLYNVLVTWSPELMLRDATSHYLDPSSSSVTFRVLVFPGTCPMSNQIPNQ